MATAAPTTTQVQTVYGHVHKTVWATLTSAIVKGDPISIPVNADRAVQFEGTFVATVVLEGSLDDDGSGSAGHYHTLHDPLGNAISTTSAGIFQVAELVRWIRPSSSGGDGTTAIVCTVLSRSTL